MFIVEPRSSKALPKAKFAPKKVMVTGCLLPIHYSFLNPDKTITSAKSAQQINEMHWKLKRLHSFPRQCLTACCTTNTSQVELG